MRALRDTELSRALAIEQLGRNAYELAAQGRHGEAIDLLSASRRQLEQTAPDERIGLLEIDMLLGWELYTVGEHHAAERTFLQALGGALDLESELGEADDPEAIPRRRVRLRRLHAKQLARERELEIRPAERLNRLIGHLSNHLGVFHLNVTQDDATACSFLEEAVRRHSGSRRASLMLAQSLGNLAAVHASQARLAEARTGLERALRTLEQDQVLKETGEYVQFQSHLGEVLDALGDEAAAERHLRQAFAGACALGGYERADVAVVQAKLGSQLLHWGCPAEAEVHLRQALWRFARTTGMGSPDATSASLALVRALWARDRLAEAAPILAEVAVQEDRDLRHRLEVGSEEIRLRGSSLSRYPLDICASIAWTTPEDEAIVKVAFDVVVRRKAMLTEILTAQRTEQREHQLESVRTEVSELDRLRGRLSEALLAGEPEQAIAEMTAEIRRREELVGMLQRLVASNPAHQDDGGAGRIRRLENLARWGASDDGFTKALPAGSALVEYVRFARMEQRPWEEADLRWHYLAFVCSSGGALTAVPLGDADLVDALVEDLALALEQDGAAMEDGVEVAYEDSATETASVALRRAVLEPLMPRLHDTRSLIIAADGALGHVPFNVLPAQAGCVVDSFEVTYVSSGRDLLRPRPGSSPSGPPLVVADPDYDAGSPTPGGGPESAERLEGTREEGLAIARMLGVEPLLDADASEPRIKAAPTPQIMHCATHGWYVPPAPVGAPEDRSRLARLTGGGVASSLARSGLILAGFNAAWAAGRPSEEFGDGLLTAGEVAALDLTGTQLVVLSACETGLGHVVYLEGSIGLRRAFLMAGSRAVLMTLWSVPDGPTLDFMKGFYRRLLAGETRATALRESQQEVREHWTHPHQWGGFALHGDPGPLDDETLARLREASPEVEEADARLGAQRRLAGEALRRGDLAGAELRATALAEAGDALGEMILGAIAVEHGNLAEGARRYARAAERGEPLAARAIAELRRAADDTKGAEHWFRMAVENGDDASRHDLAVCLRQSGARDEALRIWREGAEGGNPDCQHAIGNEASLDGDHDAARRWWERAARAGVDRAAHNLAGLAREQGDDEEFERWWRRAAELGQPDAAKHFAMAANEAGRRDEALELWKAAALKGDAESAHNLGVVLQDTRPLEAEHWYQRAADAGFPQSANNLGGLLVARGDLDGAAHYWQVAVEAGHAAAPVHLGDLMLLVGRVDDACRWLRPAAERGDLSAAEALARALEQQGESNEAREWLLRAADGRHPLAAHAAAKAAVETGDLERAVTLLEVAAQGGAAGAFTTYGDLHQEAGRSSAAEQFWKAAAARGDADALLRLGLLQFRRGETDEARSTLTEARDAGQDEAEYALRLVGLDEPLAHSRAARGHLHAIDSLLGLAVLREDEADVRRWMLAAAEAGDLDAMLQAGQAAAADSDHGSATRWFSEAAARGLSDAARAMAALCESDGRSKDALQWSDRAARLTAAHAANARGWDAYANGSDSTAEAAWRASAEGGLVEATGYLGSMLVARGEPDAAEPWLRRAAARDPAAANALGTMLAERGSESDAEVWLTHAIDLSRGR